MPTHDIIDNRNSKLLDTINTILGSSQKAHFAVGYFFLSGFDGIAEKLQNVQELRLLIGNTTNRETLEQIAEGYRRLELVAEHVERQAYTKRTEANKMAVETVNNIRNGIELMDQTDKGEYLINTLVEMITQKRMKVRVYTKGRMHAKAYVFDYGPMYDGSGNAVERLEKGIAVVGSSNLTLSGITNNTELNVIVQGNDNHNELTRWFEDLWDEAQVFEDTLMTEMKQSWAALPARPYDVYMKTLYNLVKDRLEGDDDQDILWDDEIRRTIAKFQEVAVRQAVQIIRDYGGAFVSDVVGLGKSFVGSAIIKHFERTTRSRPLIICPASLVSEWEKKNEEYDLNARVLSMGYLLEENGSSDTLTRNPLLEGRNFILVDESHNLRNPETQRYRVMQTFLATGRRCCYLTATPRNKSAWDIYNQIKLFHQDDITDLPIDPPNLRQYFKLIESGERKLPDLLSHLLIRRTRNHVLRWYGFDSETHQPVDPSRFEDYIEGRKRAYIEVAGRHQFFPQRELETINYCIEDTYRGLYHQIRGYLGRKRADNNSGKLISNELTYARYGLWHYVKEDYQEKEPYVSLHRAGKNLRGLMRVMLFKRFESSVFAFRETVRKMLLVHERFLEALKNGIIPAGEDAQSILYEPNQEEEQDLLDALRKVTGKYKAEDFDLGKLSDYISHDIGILQKIFDLVEPIKPEQDVKLQTLIEKLSSSPLDNGKVLIFTQYADTARYLYNNLKYLRSKDDIDVIYSGDKDKGRLVGRFAPIANKYNFKEGETELNIVIATDVLAEGLNMQDCDKVINYDLHWNPVRLIQRFGRIDRIGSEFDVIYSFNFLPEMAIEKEIGLRYKLENRIREIHETIGEDARILEETEQLNREAMYAIYEMNGGQVAKIEEEDDELIDLNDAEEKFRQLKAEDPVEYDRIANLQDGIRSGKSFSKHKGIYVFCQAGRYQQLFLVNSDGSISSKNISRVINTISCGPGEPTLKLRRGYNDNVMKIKKYFETEIKHRQAERDHGLKLLPGQQYILRELRILYQNSNDENVKAQINTIEKAIRGVIPAGAMRELNLIRKNSMVGNALLKALGDIYYKYDLKNIQEHSSRQYQDVPIPRIICSMALE